MLLSMTGFVSKTIDLPVKNDTISITINLKSLNSRFFEANYKMPHTFGHIEPVLTKKLKSVLRRGTVQCSLHVSNLSLLNGPVNPSLNTIKGYLNSIDEIKKEFGDNYKLENGISIKDIMQLPHVFEQSEAILDKKSSSLLITVIEDMIEQLVKERRKEGISLQKDLEDRTKIMSETLKKLEKRTKQAATERRKKLETAAATMLKDASDEAKEHQTQMIYNQLEKMDIHEEIVRFSTHIKSLKKSIKDKTTEKGKKIDFTLQELFREINTIAAKCSDSELSSYAIGIKVELEKAREQAQNIV